MNSNTRAASQATAPDSRPPSSTSTYIEVGMGQTPEEELYAAVAALREKRTRTAAAAAPATTATTATVAATASSAISSSPSPDGPCTSGPSVRESDETVGSSSRSHGGSGDGSGRGKANMSSTHGTSSTADGPFASPSSSSSSSDGDEDDDDDDGTDQCPASITSSVREHVYEGGIRYHAFRAGRYAFPNDETEQNRDDMKHAMTLMLCRGAYFYAPVEPVLEAGGEVLDLGEYLPCL